MLHHLTVDLRRESFYSLKRQAAPGVDGGEHIGHNPRGEGLHSGADGRQPALGIASLKDKIVQQGEMAILNAIHEVDFTPTGFSRSAARIRRWTL